MSDTTTAVPATNPLAKGLATSEGKLTAFSVVMGILLSVFGALLPVLQAAQIDHPEVRWLGAATLICGAIISGAALFGYNKGRALVKSTQVAAMLASGVPTVVAAITQAFLNSQLPKGVAAPAAILPSEANTPSIRQPVPPVVRP
jgi:FtsH-binding integral membrane protein